MIALALIALGTGCGGKDEAPVDTGPELATVPQLSETAELVLLADEADGVTSPRDLAFNPVRTNELWVVNEDCDCTATILDPGAPFQEVLRRIDPAAVVFMDRPAAIAFQPDGEAFATCAESENTWGGTREPDYWAGPVLWPSDLDVYARVNKQGNDEVWGSNIDSMHEAPDCMGIASGGGATFWTFNGYDGEITWFDMGQPHDPGVLDDDDGSVRRYRSVAVTRLEGVASNLAYDEAAGLLFIADTGGGRVLVLDAASGTPVEGDPNDERLLEVVDAYEYVDDADVWELVPPGRLVEPSGLALYGEVVLVSDHATGEIVGFDRQGRELESFSTNLFGLMGITVGPDDKLYLVDREVPSVYRLDP